MPATGYDATDHDATDRDEFERDKLLRNTRTAVQTRVRATRPALASDPRWQLVERIAESRSLGKSPRLADFLRYVCDRQMRGRDDEITEQKIGVKVFGRPEGYNSNDDNIVRNYARTLRKRLEDYFRKEGLGEPLLVSIPRGGYTPVFRAREPGADCPEPDLDSVAEVADAFPALVEDAKVFGKPLPSPAFEATEPAVPGRLRWLIAIGSIFCGTLLVLCGYFAGQTRNPWQPFESPANRISRNFWTTLFDQQRDTFVVPADGGLVMMQSFTRAKVSLPDYAAGIYRSPEEISRGMQGFVSVTPEDQVRLTHKVATLAARRYTSVVDLNIASRLSFLREIVPERFVVRFARDLHIDDLHDANAILIGSNDANPWVAAFEPQLNFQFKPGTEYGGSGVIVNTHPLEGEDTTFRSITGDPENRTYGLIAYVPNIENTGHILIIEGVNMAGTQAAGDFLLSPEQMRPMLEHAIDSQGNIEPFEILLQTTSIGAGASRSEVLSERVHPAPAR